MAPGTAFHPRPASRKLFRDRGRSHHATARCRAPPACVQPSRSRLAARRLRRSCRPPPRRQPRRHPGPGPHQRHRRERKPQPSRCPDAPGPRRANSHRGRPPMGCRQPQWLARQRFRSLAAVHLVGWCVGGAGVADVRVWTRRQRLRLPGAGNHPRRSEPHRGSQRRRQRRRASAQRRWSVALPSAGRAHADRVRTRHRGTRNRRPLAACRPRRLRRRRQGRHPPQAHRWHMARPSDGWPHRTLLGQRGLARRGGVVPGGARRPRWQRQGRSRPAPQ